MPSTFTGADIRALRAHLGLTQAGFARLVGYAPSSVRDWERGRRRVPVGAQQKLVNLARKVARQQAALARVLSGLR